MQSHHNKHHGAYVNSLDTALKDRPKLQTKPLHELIAHPVDVPEDIRTVVRNNAGGHANHTMFWQLVGGKGATSRRDRARLRLLRQAAGGPQQDGGAGLRLQRGDGACRSQGQALAGLPAEQGFAADGRQAGSVRQRRLGHAYYLKYQNHGPEYLTPWWTILNWARIAQRYAAAKADALTI
jgi:superoxide dismutase, Fe-Mn family